MGKFIKIKNIRNNLKGHVRLKLITIDIFYKNFFKINFKIMRCASASGCRKTESCSAGLEERPKKDICVDGLLGRGAERREYDKKYLVGYTKKIK
jgi:hypothetical protein